MISETESLSDATEDVAPSERMSDRQRFHYYRAQHARAVERAKRWEEKTRAAEKIIAGLMLLLGCFSQRIQDVCRQLVWLKKQQFGRKSETSKGSESGSSPGPGESDTGEESKRPAEKEEKEAKSKTGRGRGQQRGGKGPRRKRRKNLPEETQLFGDAGRL